MKCSDFIAAYLKEQGIKIVFDFTGGMITNLEDSLSRLDGIACLPARHEQGAGFAAEGYARASQNFGVAIATSGPGATNLITAIGSCFFDSTPALFITGQVNSKDLRRHERVRQNGFQELDVVKVVSSITKYAKLVLEPNDILSELEQALFLMREGRPGPVLLDLPFNIQSADIDPTQLKKFVPPLINNSEALPNFSDLPHLLAEARSPIVLFGNGLKISKTSDKFKEFLIKNNLSSVSSLLGLGELASDQPNYLGFIGAYGNRHANIALANADLIIALGTRLDLKQTGNPTLFARQAKIIHVDIDPFERKDNFPNYVFYQADLKTFFDQMSGLTTPAKSEWLNFLAAVKQEFAHEHIEEAGFCQPNLFFEKFSSLAPASTVVVADVGQNQMWLAQSWQVKAGQSLLFSGGMGAMGFSLPAAIGAYCADQSRPVYAFMGDGGFQINIQELETIKHNNLPLKIFVLNNNLLGMVRDFQNEYFNKNYQSTVIGYSCPDLQKIAEAYGLPYFALTANDDIVKHQTIIDFAGPAIIEVALNPQTPLQPKVAYGQPIDNQWPFLSEEKQVILQALKKRFLS